MGKETLLGHVAYSPSARGGLPGMPSRHCRAIPGWSTARDTWRIRRSSGENSRGARGTLGGFREGPICWGTRGQVSLSESTRRVVGESPGLGYSGTRGTLRRKDRRVSRGGFRDTWRVPKVSPKGEFRRAFGVNFGRASGHNTYFEGVFRLDLRDAWHSPKLRSEGGFEGDFEG